MEGVYPELFCGVRVGEEKPLCDERPRVTPRGAVAPFEGVPSGSRYPGRYEPAPDTPVAGRDVDVEPKRLPP